MIAIWYCKNSPTASPVSPVPPSIHILVFTLHPPLTDSIDPRFLSSLAHPVSLLLLLPHPADRTAPPRLLSVRLCTTSQCLGRRGNLRCRCCCRFHDGVYRELTGWEVGQLRRARMLPGLKQALQQLC